MNAPSRDIADLLRSNSVESGTWRIFESREPSSPHTTITVYDSGGLQSNPKFLIDYPSVQVRVRGDISKYEETYAKSQQIKDLLLGLEKQFINGTEYIGIWAIADITSLGYDDNKRPILVSNWRIVREPPDESPSTNRDPL